MNNGIRLDQTVQSGPHVVRQHSNVTPAGREWGVTETFDRSTGEHAAAFTNCSPTQNQGRPGVVIEAYTPAETIALRHVAESVASGVPALLVGCMSGPTGLMAVKEVAFMTDNWVRELDMKGMQDPAQVAEQLKPVDPGEWIVATNVDKSSPASRQALAEFARHNPGAKVFATVDRKTDTATPQKLPTMDGFQTHVITPAALNQEMEQRQQVADIMQNRPRQQEA